MKKAFQEVQKQKNSAILDQEHLQLVMSAGNIGIWDWDLISNEISWSDEVYKIHGLEKDQFNGKLEEFSSLIHPEDYGRVTKAIQVAVERKTSFNDEFRIVNPNGKIRWISTNARIITDQTGQVTRMFGVTFDTTDQREKESNLRFLAEASKVLASSLNYQATLQNVAQLAVPEFADWCAVDIKVGDNIEQLVLAHVDPQKAAWAKELRTQNPQTMNSDDGVASVLKTGLPEFFPHVSQEVIEKAAKNEKHLELLKKLSISSAMILPITVGDQTLGAITFVSAESGKHYTTSDLLLAKEVANRASLAIQNSQLYHEAQENERKFQSFFNSNIVGVFIADSHGDIVDANEGFLRIIGYDNSALQEKRLNRWKLTPPEYRGIVRQAMDEIKEKGKAPPLEKELIKRDGSQVPVIAAATLVNQLDGTNINIILDITERKRLEQRKDEFIGIASHELKTPLTSIKGYVQILERIIEEMGDEKAKRLVSRTNTYINRLNSLIADLLDVSKIQSGKLEFDISTFDIHGLVKDAIESMEPTSNHHKIIFEESIHQDIVGDRHRLEQVVINLLSNAIKYSPDSDKVLVRISKDDKNVVIAVTDFGVGIALKNQTKLFQRFYRVESISRDFSGLGIGLYISSEIVNRHNGKIWVQSEENKGSTFYFSLPIEQSEYEKK